MLCLSDFADIGEESLPSTSTWVGMTAGAVFRAGAGSYCGSEDDPSNGLSPKSKLFMNGSEVAS